MSDRETITQPVGIYRKYTITLYDSAGVLATGYDAGDAITAQIWMGGDTPAIETPTCSWVSAPTTILLELAASDTASLAPMPYPLRVLINHSGQTILAWEGWLDLTASPGSGTAAPTYGTYADLFTYAGSWFKKLLLDSDGAGFLNERARARSYLDSIILARWRPRGLSTRTDISYGLGWYWLSEAPDPTMKGYLDANNLVITEKTKEIVAHLAISYACGSDLGPNGQDNPYAKQGRWHWNRAQALIASYVAELDTNADGLTDLVVNLGIINTRSVY